jgi:hypothetical protein
MTNRVPPRALLSTLPAAARLQLALPARPPYLALRPSSACTAPSSPHHARPPSRLATHPLSKSHRGPAPSPRPAAACRHARCRAHSRYMPASGLMRRCARPTHFATVWTRAARVHTCGRESPSRLRRPALLLHAARAGPEHATCSPVYSPRTPHRPLRSDTDAQQALRRDAALLFALRTCMESPADVSVCRRLSARSTGSR